MEKQWSDRWKGERSAVEQSESGGGGEWEEDCSTPVRKCDRRPRWCFLQPPLSKPPSSSPDFLAGVITPHGGRCPQSDRGVPSVSARRPPPGAGRSAGGYVQVPPGLRGYRRREPWVGAAWETRLDALPDAGDAGSDRAPEHLPGHHRHTFRWDSWVPNIQLWFVYSVWNDWQPGMPWTKHQNSAVLEEKSWMCAKTNGDRWSDEGVKADMS